MVKNVLIIVFTLLIAVNSQTIYNDLISINNRLALDLLNTFPTKGNHFFSPISITTALMMVMNGANGSTEHEFRQLFQIDDQTNISLINADVKTVLQSLNQRESQNLILRLANLILVSNVFALKPDYKQIIHNMFAATVQSVDFHNNSKEIREDVNNWAAKQTNNKIQNLFKENLSSDTAMVLLNAIYFKGIWKYLFNKNETRKSDFYNNGEYKVSSVDMMSIKRKFKIKRIRELETKMFEMPFEDNTHMSMFILLPDKISGLEEMTKKLSIKTFNDTMYAMSKRKGQTNTLLFPKFKLETEYDLKDSLQKLGLKSMFEDQADLSAINGKRDLKVSKAIHKGYIEVNEEGAEAAAVTKIVLLLRSYRDGFINVDRPFLFAIVDNTYGLILFLGQVKELV